MIAAWLASRAELLVARRAGVAASRVSVVRGERSRDKLVAVEGVEPDALAAALAGA